MDEDGLGLQRRQLLGGEHAGTLVQAVARVRVPEHDRVAEEQIEDRGRRDVPGEALLGEDGVERGGRRLHEPVDVVAPVVRVGADRIGLGERTVVDHVRKQPRVPQEDVPQDVGPGRARVAEPRQQLAARGLQTSRQHGLPERWPRAPQIGDVVELPQALGIAEVVLDRGGMEADDVEQHPMRVTGLADVYRLAAHPRPVVLDQAQDGEQTGQETTRAVRFAPAEPADPREGRGRKHAVRLGADADRRHRAAAADEPGEERPRVGDGRVVEDGREQLVQPVAERGRPERPLHRPRLKLVSAPAAVDGREQHRVDP